MTVSNRSFNTVIQGCFAKMLKTDKFPSIFIKEKEVVFNGEQRNLVRRMDDKIAGTIKQRLFTVILPWEGKTCPPSHYDNVNPAYLNYHSLLPLYTGELKAELWQKCLRIRKQSIP